MNPSINDILNYTLYIVKINSFSDIQSLLLNALRDKVKIITKFKRIFLP